MLQLKNISKKYNNQKILSNLSLEADKGEVIGIIGESGAGKTTLLRMMAGLEPIDSGEVWIDDQLVSSNEVFVPPYHRSIGMVFQTSALWSHMTVEKNILYAHKSDIDYFELCKRLKIDTLLNRKPNEISGGQQRRVSFARALASKPKVLLLDEATTNLNKNLKRESIELLKDYVKEHQPTVLYATHHEEELDGLASRTVRIETQGIQNNE